MREVKLEPQETGRKLLILRYNLTGEMNARWRRERGTGSLKEAAILGFRHRTHAQPGQNCVGRGF